MSQARSLVLFLMYAVVFRCFAVVDAADVLDCLEYDSLHAGGSIRGRRLPLYPLLVELLQPWLGATAGVTVSALAAAASGVVLVRLAHRLAGSTAALGALFVYPVLPFTLLFASLVHPFSLYGLLLLLTTDALVRAASSGSSGPLALATVWAGLGTLTRPEGMGLLAIVWLAQLLWVLRQRPQRRDWLRLAGANTIPVLALAYLAVHAGYLRQAGRAMPAMSIAQVGHYLGAYARSLTFLLAYGPFLLLVVGAWRLWRRPTRGLRIYLATAGALAAVHVAGLTVPHGWMAAYVFPCTLLLVLVMACGFEAVVASRRLGRCRTAVLVVLLSGGAAFTVYGNREAGRVLMPYRDAVCFVRDEHLDGGGILASEPLHARKWLGQRVWAYDRSLVARSRIVVLEDLFLRHRGGDLEDELRYLRDVHGARIVFATSGSLRPVLASGICTEHPELNWSPAMIGERFRPQWMTAVVLWIPPPEGRTREPRPPRSRRAR